MRPSLSIKTLFRTPFKTLLTFFLLAAVTFALFSRVAEYSITNREIKNAAQEYRGIGSAELVPALESYPGQPFYIKADPRLSKYYSEEARENYLNKFRYQPLSQEQIDFILELPYITASSTRYMTAGVSDKYYRLDEGEDYYNYTARFVIEGTLSEVKYNVLYFGDNYNELALNDCTLLAGDPSCFPENKKITIHAYTKKFKQYTGGGFGGSRTLIMYDDSYLCDTEYVKNLTVGNRYVFVGRFELLVDPIRFFLSDHLVNPWCEAVQPIEGQHGNYIEAEQFAPLRELIELTDSDLHTFDVVYTDDMSSIMRFAEGNMAVINGRELTMEDSLNKSNVCVVSNQFAAQNSLELGDKITLKLGTELFEQYKGLGAVAATYERYSPPDETAELEIVGIYMDADGKGSQLQKPHWSYSVNTVFVPKSLLPLDESNQDGHVFSPGEFSFTVGNAWDIPSFIENIGKEAHTFEKMGLKLIFYDDGWTGIIEQFNMSMKLSNIAILVFSGAVIVATGFIVFLFIGRKKKEYAIMRALGTTKNVSARALILPLMIVSVLAVLVGSCAAWIYTTNTVAGNDTLSIIEGYAVNTAIPLTAAAGCIIGEILLVLLFSLFELRRISAIPPLMLLQNSQNRKARGGKQAQSNKSMQDDRKPVYAETKAYVESAALSGTFDSNVPNVSMELHPPVSPAPDVSMVNASISAAPGEMTGKTNFNRVCGHVLRYITRHIRRAAVKSMLSIILPALLFGAVGQFAVMRQSYIHLCNSTVITAKFINGLSLTAITQITNTGYVIDPYYEYRNSANFNTSRTDLIITSDIERYTGEEAEIAYAEGYDASCMKELGKVCIAGGKFLEENGLKPGDKVHVTGTWILNNLQSSYINKYRSEHPEEAILDEKILELYQDEIEKKYMDEGLYYTIAGSVTTPSGKYDRIVFTPGTLRTSMIFGFEAPLDLAEFTLADNLRADEFRSYAGMVTGESAGKHLSNRITFIMDTSKIDNLLNTLRLLEKLFPVVAAAAVLIGGLLGGLIIIQAAKEAAIMRVLGTTRRLTLVILAIEQTTLCIIGLAAGACGLLLYNGPVFAEIAPKMHLFAVIYFAGCLAGALTCSAIATRRNVLELLQVKE
ncbi:MAG: ABC transporter permease [Clostridiaceae bacterium]